MHPFKPRPPLAAFAALLLAAAASQPAHAQLGQPQATNPNTGSPQLTQPSMLPPPSPVVPVSPAQQHPIGSSPSARPTQPAIANHGPSVPAASAKSEPLKTYVGVKPGDSAIVIGRDGRIVPGAVMVGPNTALDPRTGRRYTTTPAGTNQQVIGP